MYIKGVKIKCMTSVTGTIKLIHTPIYAVLRFQALMETTPEWLMRIKILYNNNQNSHHTLFVLAESCERSL